MAQHPPPRDRPERGEEGTFLQGKSDELHFPTPLQDDSTEPRVKLYVPTEESFLIPMKYIDVTRTTHTSLDVLLEKILKITETSMEKKNYQVHGRVSQDSFY